MSLRTRLVLAFFVLAVVPLCGVSLYSYRTTAKAYRSAVAAEAAATAEDLNARLGVTTRDLGQRFERLSSLPFAKVTSGERPSDDSDAQKLMADLQREIGDAAPLLKSVEFIPAVPAHPAPPAPAAEGPPPGAPHGGPPVPRALLIAPPAFVPKGLADAAQAVWVMKYKAISDAMAAVSSELRQEARRVEVEVGQGKRDAEQELQQAERETERELRKADQELRQAVRQERMAAAQAKREAAEAERRKATQERPPEADAHPAQASAAPAASAAAVAAPVPAASPVPGAELAQAALRAAQLALSGDERDKQEAARTAAELTAMAMRQAGEAIGQEARKRFGSRWGYSFDYKLKKDGAEVGTVRAQMKPDEVLAGVFSGTRRSQGEIPFALDADGKLYASGPDLRRLGPLRVEAAAKSPSGIVNQGDWVVVTRRDEQSGLTLGIARPLGSGLKEIRGAAAKNLAYGLGMTSLALVGILPLSRRLTRDLGALTEGAVKLAHGDLDARVSVRSGDEVGRLAEAFNRMAGDLRAHQEQLLHQERLRKELELGRRIQAEMLPREGLHIPFAEAKGVSIPAREVGGDFFNYFLLDGGQAALIVGDVSGKGVGAALLMANLQATLRARLPFEKDLTALARHLDEEIDRSTSTTVYLTAVIGVLGVLDSRQRVLRYVNAGHNPPFVLRHDGSVEALESTGRPLGLFPGGEYEERQVLFGEGDSLLLYTDGVVESENDAGEPFGGERLQQVLIANREVGIDGVLEHVERAVREHRGAREADDDATLLLLKIGPTAAGAAPSGSAAAAGAAPPATRTA